ncbi:MAG: zinc-ribbon domain-containing protein [Planctomycetes bacterium]|nr:zinc-ribbon domain-containing protein [Planctomycetota bacterium]
MHYGWIGQSATNSRRAESAASDAASSARKAESAMARLEDLIDRQMLVIRSLLTMCEKKGLFNEPEFRELMNEVDLSDGRLDGKFKPEAAPQNCPSCGKVNGKRAVTCMYCGVPLEGRSIL